MKKQVIAVLMLGFIALLVSGCAGGHTAIEPYTQDEAVISVDEAYMEEIVTDETAIIEIDEPSPTSVPIVNTPTESESVGQPPKRDTDTPQSLPTHNNTVTITTATAVSTPTPTATPKPTQQTAPQPTPTPAPQQAPEPPAQPTPAPTPQPTPEPTPAPTPQPTPEPTPQPTPEPTPQPVVVEPTPSRTICNTCGADITETLAEHGTAHLLAGENFSYRNE